MVYLVATEDEAFTYNKVSRIAVIQEHKMILKAIEKGVPEERLAMALNVNVSSIRPRGLRHRSGTSVRRQYRCSAAILTRHESDIALRSRPRARERACRDQLHPPLLIQNPAHSCINSRRRSTKVVLA